MTHPAGSETLMHWQVYMILCCDDSLYTGITTDIDRRIQQHAAGTGAKYFRGRQPRQVVYLEANHSRGSASRREAQLKLLSRSAKMRLVASAFRPETGQTSNQPVK